MNIKRIYLNQNPTIDLKFVQNKDDFIVDEVQNFKKSSHGRYAIVRVKKVYMTTWEMVQTISSQLRIDEKQIGYAGLKDKSATTTQYISFPASYAKSINNLKHRSIEVLELFYSDFAIQRGKLVGNRFTINLKDIKPQDLPIIYQNISHIQKHGVPNYFGYQRFGIDNKFEQSQKVACGEEIIKDKKLEHMLVSIYQSYLFNAWLAKRVTLSLKEDSYTLPSTVVFVT
jgi:tRNA pseudouridine13 synthase